MENLNQQNMKLKLMLLYYFLPSYLGTYKGRFNESEFPFELRAESELKRNQKISLVLKHLGKSKKVENL